MSSSRTRGSGTATDARPGQALVATLRQHPLPGLQRGRGRPQQHRHALQVAAVDGQVARRVARAFLLLERGVVLLVDDDQAQARQRRKDRQPRAQHQVGLAQVGQQPVAQPLRRGQAAVQADQHAARKALGKARFELRREVDLRHQHQHLLPGGQRILGGVQIDLGLAAAGDAVQQPGCVARAMACRAAACSVFSVGAWGPPGVAAGAAARPVCSRLTRRARRVLSSLRSSGGNTLRASSPNPRW
jgi:hypothetical protein